MRKTDYEQTFKLQHNEIPAKINQETGEIKELRKANHVSDSHVVFEPTAQFSKAYSASWIFLSKQLKPHEYKAAHTLALRAKAFTNSLEPLNDSTVLSILIEELGVGKNQVKHVLDKLFELGVYGKFSVAIKGKPYTNYWILNPYLQFNGKVIDKSITDLFKGTEIERAFRGEIK